MEVNETQRDYEPKKNTVVTIELLDRLMEEQQSAKKKSRFARTLAEVEDMRLEYLNISKIDCLWPLANLMILKLNNNAIEKIENLDSLINLCELDLSFNRIKKIENLKALANVHILSFYDNEVEIIEGLDSMRHLSVLSMGKNSIDGFEHIAYLRQFKKLRSLQITGNPCTQRDGYKSRLFAIVPQLVYYGYKMIPREERESAAQEHGRAVEELKEAETREEKERAEYERAEERVALLDDSFLEDLEDGRLFDTMFQNDKDGNEFSKLSSEAEEARAKYRQAFSELCQELVDFGLTESKKRDDELADFKAATDKTIHAAKVHSREVLSELHAKRSEITARISLGMQEAAAAADGTDLADETFDEIERLANELSKEFNAYAAQVWANLMREETALHDRIEASCRLLEGSAADLALTFWDAAQEYFARLRALEAGYNESVLQTTLSYLTTADEDDKSPFVQLLLDDKDAFANALSSSTILHVQTIDDRQDRMQKRLKDWQTSLIEKINSDETNRSRNRVLEITHFVNYYRENATADKILGQQTTYVEDYADGEEGAEDDDDDDDEEEGEEEGETSSSMDND